MIKRGMYEPEFGPCIVRPTHAHYTERVRIVWRLPDGSFFSTWHLCPTPEMVEAGRKEDDDGKILPDNTHHP